MKVYALTKGDYGPLSENGNCGVWTHCEVLEGEYTADEAAALIGTISPSGRRIMAAVQYVAGICYASSPAIAGVRRDWPAAGA